jgi:hypothetical protein
MKRIAMTSPNHPQVMTWRAMMMMAKWYVMSCNRRVLFCGNVGKQWQNLKLYYFNFQLELFNF